MKRLYTYECSSGTCGEAFERLVEVVKRDAAQVCPVCGGPAERLFTAPVIVFRGPGFYSTDKKGE